MDTDETRDPLTLEQLADGLRVYLDYKDRQVRNAGRLLRDYHNSREFEQILADTRLKTRRMYGRP